MHTAAVAADTGLCEQPIRLQPWQQRVIETRTCGLQESTGEGDGSVEDDRYEQEGSRWCCLTGVCSAVCDSRGIKDREELKKKKKKKKWQQRVNTEMWSVALTTDWPVTDHTVCWTLSRANSLTASSSIHHPHYRSGASISGSSSGDRGQLLIRLRCVRQSCTEHISLSVYRSTARVLVCPGHFAPSHTFRLSVNLDPGSWNEQVWMRQVVKHSTIVSSISPFPLLISALPSWPSHTPFFPGLSSPQSTSQFFSSPWSRFVERTGLDEASCQYIISIIDCPPSIPCESSSVFSSSWPSEDGWWGKLYGTESSWETSSLLSLPFHFLQADAASRSDVSGGRTGQLNKRRHHSFHWASASNDVKHCYSDCESHVLFTLSSQFTLSLLLVVPLKLSKWQLSKDPKPINFSPFSILKFEQNSEWCLNTFLIGPTEFS